MDNLNGLYKHKEIPWGLLWLVYHIIKNGRCSREPLSVPCGSLHRRAVWRRMDTCLSMAESLHCPLESITTLLIGYTPISNKKFFKKEGALKGFISWMNRGHLLGRLQSRPQGSVKVLTSHHSVTPDFWLHSPDTQYQVASCLFGPGNGQGHCPVTAVTLESLSSCPLLFFFYFLAAPKSLWKEEKRKAKEKRKDIPIWMQSSKE